MEWIIQYRRKGDNRILTAVRDLHFSSRNGVLKWFRSAFATPVPQREKCGHRMDYEFMNAKPISVWKTRS